MLQVGATGTEKERKKERKIDRQTESTYIMQGDLYGGAPH
jgi:hypothetical protein